MITTTILSSMTSLMNRKSYDYDSILVNVPFCSGIPKCLVQTCPNIDALPEEIGRIRTDMMEKNSGWSFELYDDAGIERYIEKNYGAVILDYFKRIDSAYGAAKADFFRYLRIYHDGGVYLDIKSAATIPLDDVLLETDSLVLSFWGSKNDGYRRVHYSALPKYMTEGEVAQWFVIASPGHPVMRQLIIEVLMRMDNYNPYSDGVGWTGTVCTTGPVVYSSIMYKFCVDGNRDIVRWVNVFDDFCFRYSIYDSVNSDSSFHAKMIKSDYRKGTTPVIKHRNPLIQAVNCFYLRLLAKYKKRHDS